MMYPERWCRNVFNMATFLFFRLNLAAVNVLQSFHPPLIFRTFSHYYFTLGLYPIYVGWMRLGACLGQVQQYRQLLSFYHKQTAEQTA